jgi:hypothetical protein
MRHCARLREIHQLDHQAVETIGVNDSESPRVLDLLNGTRQFETRLAHASGDLIDPFDLQG